MRKCVAVVVSLGLTSLFAATVTRTDIEKTSTDYWNTSNRVGIVVDECSSSAPARFVTVPLVSVSVSGNALSSLDCVAWTSAVSPAGNLNSERRCSLIIVVF